MLRCEVLCQNLVFFRRPPSGINAVQQWGLFCHFYVNCPMSFSKKPLYVKTCHNRYKQMWGKARFFFPVWLGGCFTQRCKLHFYNRVKWLQKSASLGRSWAPNTQPMSCSINPAATIFPPFGRDSISKWQHTCLAWGEWDFYLHLNITFHVWVRELAPLSLWDTFQMVQ